MRTEIATAIYDDTNNRLTDLLLAAIGDEPHRATDEEVMTGVLGAVGERFAAIIMTRADTVGMDHGKAFEQAFEMVLKQAEFLRLNKADADSEPRFDISSFG